MAGGSEGEWGDKGLGRWGVNGGGGGGVRGWLRGSHKLGFAYFAGRIISVMTVFGWVLHVVY